MTNSLIGDSSKYKVVKIKPGWECAGKSNGQMLFEYTNVPKAEMKKRKRVSDKVMKELESRMKL